MGMATKTRPNHQPKGGKKMTCRTCGPKKVLKKKPAKKVVKKAKKIVKKAKKVVKKAAKKAKKIVKA